MKKVSNGCQFFSLKFRYLLLKEMPYGQLIEVTFNIVLPLEPPEAIFSSALLTSSKPYTSSTEAGMRFSAKSRDTC